MQRHPTPRHITVGVTALFVAMSLFVAGCASPQFREDGASPRGAPPEYQDTRTGVTVTRAEKPLIFAVEGFQSGNLRDYISLMAAATNRTGNLRYLLLVYVWSADSAVLAADGRPLFVTADDQRLSFESVPTAVFEADLSAPIPRPARAGPLWAAYATDLATLASLAAAQRLQVQISAEPSAPRFELWDDQRAALDRFVRYLNGE